jgi:NAD(P)-dependent dehydrogenase (short-subunit alcohol dehydrogenase family)
MNDMPSVLITGASTGIGEACALRMHARGWRVFAGVRKPQDGESLRAQTSERLHPLMFDVRAADEIAAAARTIDAQLGARGLDGLVNNAGIVMAGPLEYLPIDAFRDQLEINVTGQIAVTQAVMPALRRAAGRIVFMGSIAGRSALPYTGAYAASKFAIEAVADALRLELRPWRMPVIVIEPGTIETPIWQTSLATAERILAAAPTELEERYGKHLEGVRHHARHARGLPASAVADAVEHALTAHRPRLRYLVGRDTRLRMFVEQYLPTRLRDALIAQQLDKL